MTGWKDRLSTLATEHLPEEVAAKWIELFRPAARLVSTKDGGRIVGHLGGHPTLPSDQEWPTWPGHGPLTFIALINCAELPRDELDIPLPEDGTLLFFYFDGQLDQGKALVSVTRPETMAGARVIFVPAETTVSERRHPEGLSPYSKVDLVAEVIATAPEWGHRALRQTRLANGVSLEEAVDHPGIFDEVLWEADGIVGLTYSGPYPYRHRIGGYAAPDQQTPEYEAAVAALGGVPWDDPRLADEETRWGLLAQIDSDGRDSNMLWGDGGSLYWLIRPDDLAARRFDAALFTWQCA